MTREDWIDCARRIHDVPRAPQSRASIEATADDLASICCHPVDVAGETWLPEQQVAWLVAQVRETWEEWRGPRGLRDVHATKFNPPPEQRPFVAIKPPTCPRCGDTGYVVVQRGMYEGAERCVCAGAQQTELVM